MREDICSIPINEVFEVKQGCPICRLRDIAEERMAVYITGAAMMEPDVREETNRLGFCSRHFDQILSKGSRLSIALILESLLAQVQEETLPEGKLTQKKALQNLHTREKSCFICENLSKSMAHSLACTIDLWQREQEFRTLYTQQEYICLPHYGLLLQAGEKLPRKLSPQFQADTLALVKNYLETLRGDVTHFCRMYDYRNAGGDWGNSKDSIQRAVRWLTGREPDMTQNAGEKNR